MPLPTEYRCSACGKPFATEAQSLKCRCAGNARTKLELCEDYDLWPAMARAGFSRLTKANIAAFKQGLKP